MTDFMPHGMCFLWRRDILTLHVVADLLVAFSYFCIPVLLLVFVRRRPALRRMGWLFATFIVSCGLTHLSEVWTIWHPDYWVSGTLKALTAAASLSTVAALLPLMPYGRILRRFSDLDRINAELESQYRLIVEGTSDGIWLVDGVGRTTFVNPRLTEMLGLEAGQLVGTPLDAFVHEETGAVERTRIAERPAAIALRDAQRGNRFEVCLRRGDGKPLWTEMHVAALRDADGRPVGAVVTVADVTETRRARLALAESMRQYQILAEAMPHAVFTADANGAISYGNRAWHDTIGSNDAASPDWNWLASLHPEDAPRGRAAWMHAVDACEPFEKQLRFRRATDGMYRWFVCRATPVCDPFGKVERWIGSTADIHDYKVASETRGVLDALGHLVSIRNADGRFDYVSPNLALVTGIAADADWYDALHPDDRACVFGERREAGEAERAIRQDEIRLRTSDDDYRWFLSRTVHLAGETAPRQICTLTDIDDLKRTQAAFAESEASYRALIESMPQMVWIEDRDIRVRYVNGRWLEYTGLPFTPGMPSSTIAISHPDDLAAVEAAHEARCAGSEIDCEVRLRRHDGVYRWHLIRTVPLGDGTQSATWVVTGTDIEERKAAETALARSAEDLAHRAHHDPLTGLLNRSHLAERLAALIDAARTDGSELAVMYLDLDHFKAINDSLGHNAGDELLVEVARRISLALRNDDLASRFGGDEFVMVCRAGSDDVVNVAERVQARVAAPLGVCGRRVVTAASIGISLFPRDGSTAAELIHRADVAMYAAKEAGRNGWARYNANAHLESEESIDLEVELREAISQRQFVVFYQPIVNLADGRPVGAEALVRWLHPTRGLLGPGEFIAFAEQHGLIAPIGEIVLETVCAEVAQRTSAPTRSLRFAVNVSARQFAKPGFVEFLEGTIARAGIDARDLEIEITESVVMGNSASVAGTLDAVRALGVSIAIDDFGTGYGSLAYIKSFAVDTLKIDRSFVAGIGHDPTDRAIATTIVALARSLGMRTVAEGIETVEQLDHMREIGADLAQGYLICRPVPAAEFLAFLEATART